jgi:hypothetical protein
LKFIYIAFASLFCSIHISFLLLFIFFILIYPIIIIIIIIIFFAFHLFIFVSLSFLPAYFLPLKLFCSFLVNLFNFIVLFFLVFLILLLLIHFSSFPSLFHFHSFTYSFFLYFLIYPPVVSFVSSLYIFVLFILFSLLFSFYRCLVRLPPDKQHYVTALCSGVKSPLPSSVTQGNGAENRRQSLSRELPGMFSTVYHVTLHLLILEYGIRKNHMGITVFDKFVTWRLPVIGTNFPSPLIRITCDAMLNP